MSLDQLEAEILKLPRDVRARLAERLISSLDEESEIEKAWVGESERRYQRYLGGDTEAIPIKRVLTKLREELDL